MIPDIWYTPWGAYLWQVSLHSAVAAGLLYLWSRRLRIPSGRFRRRLHALVLSLPLVTAAVPGRGGLLFREQSALFDSYRFLILPLGPTGYRVYHLVVMIALLTALAGLWQELAPLIAVRRGDVDAVPERLLLRARSLPGWQSCRVELGPWDTLEVATGGSLRRPRLLLSEGALRRLEPEELDAVLLHENAHWQRGRWRATHLLFLLRFFQLPNPVALWVFREYTIETEIDCDLHAAQLSGPKPLARALLEVYRGTDRRDIASRGILRKRIDVLTGTVPVQDDPVPAAALAVATLLLGGVLPWIV